MEVFKVIPGYPDYEISNFGRVKTISRPLRYVHAVTKNEHTRISTERFLRIHNSPWGYKLVMLYRDKKPKTHVIHRLVALTFLENADNLPVVNHKDGNKHNNCVDNLEWCTDAYNHEHAAKTGLLAKGSRVAGSKLTERCVGAIKFFLDTGVSHATLAKAFNVQKSTITQINTGVSWKHITLSPREELSINL